MNRERREGLAELSGTNQVGRYAIFARSSSGTRAKFRSMHDDKAVALQIAQDHAAELVAQGHQDFTFYVVQVVASLGIENGKYAVNMP